MSTTTLRLDTVADLLERLGGIPARRVLLTPTPGTATEADVLAALEEPRKRICELIDGVLVEKDMSTTEGYLAGHILRRMGAFAEDEHDLGLVFPGDTLLKLRPGLVRAPDACFIPWDRIPDESLPKDAIASLVPELTVEVITPNNTSEEIHQKLTDYFSTGCKLSWVIDPDAKSAKVYTSSKRFKELNESGTLDGGKVLPGFKLPLAELFAATKRRKKKPR